MKAQMTSLCVICAVTCLLVSGCVDQAAEEPLSDDENLTWEDYMREVQQNKEEMQWIYDFEEALEKAKNENKWVYIDFFTADCSHCCGMNRETYTDPRIVNLLTETFIAVKLNRKHPNNTDVVKKYKIYMQPWELVIDFDGETLWSHIGFIDADGLYTALMSFLSPDRSTALLSCLFAAEHFHDSVWSVTRVTEFTCTIKKYTPVIFFVLEPCAAPLLDWVDLSNEILTDSAMFL